MIEPNYTHKGLLLGFIPVYMQVDLEQQCRWITGRGPISDKMLDIVDMIASFAGKNIIEGIHLPLLITGEITCSIDA